LSEETKDIKKGYEVLKGKFNLPSFEELDSEFEISAIESESFLIRKIRRKLAERAEEAVSLAEEALQPDNNLSDLYESRVLTESEKRELFELYKKLMSSNRKLTELSILNDDKSDADFIIFFSEEWKGIKPQLAKFIARLKESWEKDTEEGETAAYMG
jgi:hypothetical protein